MLFSVQRFQSSSFLGQIHFKNTLRALREDSESTWSTQRTLRED